MTLGWGSFNKIPNEHGLDSIPVPWGDLWRSQSRAYKDKVYTWAVNLHVIFKTIIVIIEIDLECFVSRTLFSPLTQ
jgi:hypothetical protein